MVMALFGVETVCFDSFVLKASQEVGVQELPNKTAGFRSVDDD
jgi:hypothetical protein